MVIPITDLRKVFVKVWKNSKAFLLVRSRRDDSSILQIFLRQLVPQAKEVRKSPVDSWILLLEVGQVGRGGDCVGHVGRHTLPHLNGQGQTGLPSLAIVKGKDIPCEGWSLSPQ